MVQFCAARKRNLSGKYRQKFNRSDGYGFTGKGVEFEESGNNFHSRQKDRLGYHGPRPLPEHDVHHYYFHLVALDVVIPPDPACSEFEQLLSLVNGHVIANTTPEGIQLG